MVLSPEDRPDPSLSNDKLASLISELKELTMIKEAASLVLLFDYFISDKTDTARYEEAKKLGGPDFETINSSLDIDKTSANKIQSIAAFMTNTLNEISSFDIRNMINLPPEDSSDDILGLNAIELNEEALALLNHGVYTDVAQAIEYLNRAIRLDSDFSTAYNNLGLAYEQRGNYDRAIEYYQKALKIDLKKLGSEHPEVAIRYNNLGWAYQLRGDYDRAIV